jgi:hypothetical protein
MAFICIHNDDCVGNGPVGRLHGVIDDPRMLEGAFTKACTESLRGLSIEKAPSHVRQYTMTILELDFIVSSSVS